MNNFAVPTSLEGLSLGTILLALLGNGLMVPRALFTRDSIWLLGSAWGSAFGWLQLLSMFVGRSASGCAPVPTGRVAAASDHAGRASWSVSKVLQISENWRRAVANLSRCLQCTCCVHCMHTMEARCQHGCPVPNCHDLKLLGPRRQPYVGDLLFYSVTAAFVSCVLVVLSADARSKGVSFPLGSIASLFTSPQEATETS